MSLIRVNERVSCRCQLFPEYPNTIYAATKKGWIESTIFENYVVDRLLPPIPPKNDPLRVLLKELRKNKSHKRKKFVTPSSSDIDNNVQKSKKKL